MRTTTKIIVIVAILLLECFYYRIITTKGFASGDEITVEQTLKTSRIDYVKNPFNDDYYVIFSHDDGQCINKTDKEGLELIKLTYAVGNVESHEKNAWVGITGAITVIVLLFTRPKRR